MRAFLLAPAAVVVMGCGGSGGGGGGGGGTPPPPPVTSVVLTPPTAQSITVGGTVQFSAQPKDAQGGNLTRTVTWSSSDLTKVTLSPTTGASTTATGVAAGVSNVVATSEGRTAQVQVTVTAASSPPQSATVTATAASTFDPASVTIGAGGTVTWTFVAVPDHNVTFTSSNVPPGGNIPTTSNTSVSRSFPNVGSYPYTCTLHAGMNGTVTVVAP